MKFLLTALLSSLLAVPALGLAQIASPSQIDANSNLTNQNAGNSVAGSTNVVYGENNSTSSTSADNTVFGYGNQTNGSVNYVYGYFNTVAGTDNLSMGEFQSVEGTSIICLGVSGVCGNDPTASQFDGNIGIGSFVTATGSSSIAIGSSAQATETGGVALGWGAWSTAPYAVALGSGTSAGYDDCLALGTNSWCTARDQASFGQPGYTRTLSFVSPGVASTDAVNVSQLTATLAMFGGGAGLDAKGNPLAPMYVLTNPYTPGSYSTVGDALTALDSAIGDVSTQPGPAGPQGPAGANGKDATGGPATDPLAVHYDSASDSDVTLQGAGGTTIHNVAAGVAPTDAANVSQIQEALHSANNYTDLKATATLAQANAYTDLRVGGLNDKINAARAAAAAEANMVGTYAGADPRSPNRMATAVGNFGNRNAMALGYQHVSVQSRNRWTWNASATLDSAGRSSVGAGFGFSW